jgi:hypothetical protein
MEKIQARDIQLFRSIVGKIRRENNTNELLEKMESQYLS